MTLAPQTYTKWSDRIAFDIALRLEGSGEDLNDICLRHNILTRDILAFNKDPIFRDKVTAYRADIAANGITFKMKARAQAEELLVTSWMLIHSADVSPAVKADLIKSTVKWGGLEPKPTDGEVSSGGVKITINIGGGDEPRTIEAVATPQIEDAA